MTGIEPTPATARIAEQELAALRPSKVDLKLWHVTVSMKPNQYVSTRTFFLDAFVQALHTREMAMAYAENLLEGDDRVTSITVFPIHYTVTAR